MTSLYQSKIACVAPEYCIFLFLLILNRIIEFRITRLVVSKVEIKVRWSVGDYLSFSVNFKLLKLSCPHCNLNIAFGVCWIEAYNQISYFWKSHKFFSWGDPTQHWKTFLWFYMKQSTRCQRVFCDQVQMPLNQHNYVSPLFKSVINFLIIYFVSLLRTWKEVATMLGIEPMRKHMEMPPTNTPWYVILSNVSF